MTGYFLRIEIRTLFAGNVPDNLVQLAHLRIYFSPTGALNPVADFVVLPTTALSGFTLPDYLTILLTVIFVGLICNEIYEIKILGLKDYFDDNWNYMDVAVYALGLVWCVIVLRARLVGWHRVNNFASGLHGIEDLDSRFLNLWDVGVFFLHSEIIVSVALMVSRLICW